MYNLSEFYFTRVLPTKYGILAYAQYQNWRQEFSFLVQPDGAVKGRSVHGSWLDLTQELASFIKSKIQSILIEKSELLHAY